jgi:hypothetical protein
MKSVTELNKVKMLNLWIRNLIIKINLINLFGNRLLNKNMYCKICGKWQTTIVSARKHVIEYHPEQNHFMDCYEDDSFSNYDLIQESKRRGYRAIAHRSPIEFHWLGNLGYVIWWYHSDYNEFSSRVPNRFCFCGFF